jgi:hypothetical protein
MAAPVAAPVATESLSHADWLKTQQSRYTHTVKTAEQFRAEYAAMTFQQLRTRAGPPPTVRAEDFVWAAAGCRPDEAADAEHTLFDGRMSSFKRGEGAPPAPLAHNQRGDSLGTMNVSAYTKWYAAWGAKLNEKWNQEHPRLPTKTKTVKPKPVEEETKESRRVAEEAGDKSGW